VYEYKPKVKLEMDERLTTREHQEARDEALVDVEAQVDETIGAQVDETTGASRQDV
jgi:hypothetical protein